MTNYEKLIEYIRENILDLNPVNALRVIKQDLVLSISATELTTKLGDAEPVVKPLSEISKLYKVVTYFQSLGVEVRFYDLYIPLTESTNLSPITDVSLSSEVPLKIKNFFSIDQVHYKINEFFNYKYPYRGADFTADDYFLNLTDKETEFNSYEDFELRIIALWVSFFLLEDKKTILYASQSYENIQGTTEDSYVNTDKQITTRINDVFTITETPKKEEGDSAITSIWGDSDGFISKLQLSIRNKYEKLSNDFSLRNNPVIQSQIHLEKHWFQHAHDYKDQDTELSRTIPFENR